MRALPGDARARVAGHQAAAVLLAQLPTAGVRGAQDLQLQMQPDVQVIEINTGEVRATDFAGRPIADHRMDRPESDEVDGGTVLLVIGFAATAVLVVAGIVL